MSDKIFSVIRCMGFSAGQCVHNQIRSNVSPMYAIHKINNSNEDQIIWFSFSHDDFRREKCTEKFLLDKLQELGKGTIYDNPSTTKKCNEPPISGTINCGDGTTILKIKDKSYDNFEDKKIKNNYYKIEFFLLLI